MAEANKNLDLEDPQPRIVELATRLPRTELRAVVFPELGKRDNYESLEPTTEAETLDK